MVPIELPLKRDYCGSDSGGSDIEGTDTEHELDGTEDHTVAFRQSPRTNRAKRKRAASPKNLKAASPKNLKTTNQVSSEVNFEDSD